MIKTIKKVITSDALKSAFTTPVILVEKKGANTVIRPISASIQIYASTTGYTMNACYVKTTYGDPLFTFYPLIFGTSAGFYTGEMNNSLNLFASTNEDLIFTVDISDPEKGDGDIAVFVTYEVLNIN